jgi:hypothetical protein
MLIAIVAILFLSKCLSTGLKWHLANQNLDLAMLVVQQLQEKYLAARFIFTYYSAAFEKVAPAQRPSLDTGSEAGLVGAFEGVSMSVPEGEKSVATGIDGMPTAGVSTGLYDASGPFTAVLEEDPLGAWGDCFPDSADFDILFGVDGIFRGLEEFDVGNMVT